MHEVIGHGSGKLTDRLKGGAEPFLKEYFSALEEARADLMGLYNIWDPKLKELGLITDQESVARAMYDAAARASLTQLRRIPKGDTIEEDHQRGRALIANFVKDKTGAIEQIDRDGKTYIRVKDYQKMREGVGLLLARADADQGGRRLRRDQNADRQVRRALRSEAARPGGRALQATESAHVLGRRQSELTAAARRQGQRVERPHLVSARRGEAVSPTGDVPRQHVRSRAISFLCRRSRSC